MAHSFFLCLYTKHFCLNLFKERAGAQLEELVSKTKTKASLSSHLNFLLYHSLGTGTGGKS